MCGLLAYSGKAQDLENFETEFQKIHHRGPNDTATLELTPKGFLAFHRLSIMDTSEKGNQPLLYQKAALAVICNGEIYNFKDLREYYSPTYEFLSHSDCEVILPLFADVGIEKTCQTLDGEYAFVLYAGTEKKLFAARDPMGIRPLFYGTHKKTGEMLFASEAKAILAYCHEVAPFPPGHYYDGSFHAYVKLDVVKAYHTHSDAVILKNIRDLLVEGVRKRLVSDVPLGFLLSGGVDSALVVGIATKLLKKPVTTFCVGLDENPIDIKYAKMVADFCHSKHHESYFTKKDVLKVLEPVIVSLESWDITTIRASIGMYLVCKYIKENTPIKVVLSGEVSDELFGYKYTDFAPSGLEFQEESQKRIRELYMYDVLRADRCISAHSLEARVPFSDQAFVEYVMAIPPEKKMNTTGIGKYLLRKAFEADQLIPHEILYRNKAAFSDAVGHGMVDLLKEEAEKKYTDQDLLKARERYPHGTPFTKEALWYREIFEKHFTGQSALIKDFWMPNKTWPNCNVLDPSARVLSNYGTSGT